LFHAFRRLWKNWWRQYPRKHLGSVRKIVLRDEAIVEYFYQSIRVVADASHQVLPQVHITSYSALLPFCSHLLTVCD